MIDADFETDDVKARCHNLCARVKKKLVSAKVLKYEGIFAFWSAMLEDGSQVQGGEGRVKKVLALTRTEDVRKQ